MSITPQTISAYLNSEDLSEVRIHICPKYEHDCDECVYHGRLYADQTYDVWTCEAVSSEIVLRYGNDGHYRSMERALAENGLGWADYGIALLMIRIHEERGVALRTRASYE